MGCSVASGNGTHSATAPTPSLTVVSSLQDCRGRVQGSGQEGAGVCAAGPHPTVPGVSTVRWHLPGLGVGGGQGEACPSPMNLPPCAYLTRYLRKAFFPKHQDLQFAGTVGVPSALFCPHPDTGKSPTSRLCGAGTYCPQPCFLCPASGLLNPLDSPHHMRQDEEAEFREGVVVDRPTRPGHGSFVNCGMKKVAKGGQGAHGPGAVGAGSACKPHADGDLGQRSATNGHMS